MKRKLKKSFALFVSVVMVAALLTGCGMNKGKAIGQMEEALRVNSDLQSGRLSAEISGEVALGADAIPIEMTMEGSFKDQLQTMAVKTSGEIMGMPMDTEAYQLDGYSYTLDPDSGKYIKTASATAGLDLQKLMTLNQDEMVDLYVQGAQADENFAFAEEEKGLRVQFTMPAEQLASMNDVMSSIMIDELLPVIEQQMRENVMRQLAPAIDEKKENETQKEQEMFQELIDQQIEMIVEMERRMFQSLEIGALSCDLLIEDGVINDQSIHMELSFDMKSVMEEMKLNVEGTLPESYTMNMDIHSLIENRNEDIQIEMPDFSDANLLEE